MVRQIICIAVIVLVGSLCFAADTAGITGKPAPVFRLKDKNSAAASQFNLGDWVTPDSSSAVIVSFFATWCAPCRKELPFLQKMTDSLSGGGLRMVAVSVDSVYGAAQKEMVTDARLSCPVVHDKYGIVARRYECGKALPYTVFVRRNGVVEAVSTGFDDKKKPAINRYISTILEAH